MEAAIRWSPHSRDDNQQFLVIDVAGNRLERFQRFEEVQEDKSKKWGIKSLARRERLPNYTAFDWSRTHESLVSIGSASGEIILLDLSGDDPDKPFVHSFPIKHQRKCNSIAFSRDDLLATGLDRVRNDFCMNVYDVNQRALGPGDYQEPYRKLSSSEAITSIKFFSGYPQTLLAGVARQCIRFYDLRDSSNYGVAQCPTRYVHNLAIDPLDENSFISAGPPGEPAVTLWDKRFMTRSVPSTPTSDSGSQSAVLELRPAVDYTTGSGSSTGSNANIWSLRFSGQQRGKFSVLSSTGEIKSYEIGGQAVDISHLESPVNPYGGSTWTSKLYVKYTHTVSLPWHEAHHDPNDETRSIAFDFMTGNSHLDEQQMIILRADRSISFSPVPSPPSITKFSTTDELLICKSTDVITARASSQSQSVAEDLQRYQASDDTVDNSDQKIPIDEALFRLSVQRRRCYEGYLFDCNRNKRIVANETALVEMWDMIGHFEEIKSGDGLVADALDLSFMGVHNIWRRNIGRSVNRALTQSESRLAIDEAVRQINKLQKWPIFDRGRTQFPYHRQLCLAICGWALTREALEEKCSKLLDEGAPYKAIVLAVFHDHRDIASRVLKSAVQKKQIMNLGLGAIIMVDNLSSQQREMCSWMADESDDPYLKALLTYLVRGNWYAVIGMRELPLADRVGVALLYCDDNTLNSFLDSTTVDVISEGNTAGLVLTGLAQRSIDLFQNYINRTNDLQTAVLALSFSNPLYVRDTRYKLWKETYFMQLQTWQAFLKRTEFITQHNRLAVLPKKHRALTATDGLKPLQQKPRSVVKVPRGQITIQCPYCQKNIAASNLESPPTPEEPDSAPEESGASMPTSTSTLPSSQNGPITSGRLQQRSQGRARKAKMWTGAPDPDDAEAVAVPIIEGLGEASCFGLKPKNRENGIA
ncbi:MAG: hypothetical protein M1820_005999 [Bogoriella megaspora]|nr:MAG: hypothetical protein M1820_005999 [Bogoriella megaspora]